MSIENEQHDIRALPMGCLLLDFRIEAVLGQGGFGITYLAIDTMLNRRVAIKEFFPRDCAVRDNTVTVKAAGNQEDRDQFKEGLKRFLAEARVLALFEHPNIVPVRRFFEANGTAYLVMDYCEGVPLDQVISKNGPLNKEQLNKILTPLLSGLETIHSANFLHRDIKPANIFIRSDGSPVLLDFGAAKQDMASRSVSVTSMFTPHYGAFEQLSAKGKQGPYTDIYGLAATLYRAATGERPEDSADRILQDNLVPALIKAAGNFNERILVAIDAGMAIRPEQRPQTVAEWRRMFGQLADIPRTNEAPQNKNTGDPLKTSVYDEPPKPIKLSKSEGDSSTSSTKKILAGIAGLAIVVAGALFVIYSSDQKKNQELIKEIAVIPTATPTPLPSANVKPEITTKQTDEKSELLVVSLPLCKGEYSATTWKNCIGVKIMKKEGNTYSGEFGPNGEYSGRGIYKYVNGQKYEGQFKAGLPDGKGVSIYADGNKYIGDYKNGAWDGMGTFTMAMGHHYKGEFKKGMFSGKGTYSFQDGAKYVGNFLEGKYNGEGTLYGSDGKVIYAGIWKDNQQLNNVAQIPKPKKGGQLSLEQCNYAADELKKTLPKTLDSISFITSAYCYMSGERVTIAYKVEIDSSEKFTQLNINSLRNDTKRTICLTPDLRNIVKEDANLEYRYYYSSKSFNYSKNAFIGTLIFNQSDCP